MRILKNKDKKVVMAGGKLHERKERRFLLFGDF